jgi:hypothetical protein
MSINSNLAVMRNAFSTASINPKVPDGKVASSTAVREATCSVFSFPSGVTRTVFVLQPTLSHSLSTFPFLPAVAANPTATPPVLPRAAGFFGTAVAHSDELLSTNSNAPNYPDKWRIVSCALRLSCINASEYNNGWFEAIRYNPKSSSFATATGSNGASIGLTAFVNDTEGNLMNSASWANSPSYVTGKLANLYKHQFNLHTTSDREFVTGGPDRQIDNFDVILVRVHALAASTTSPAPAIHYHEVTNYECVYDAGSSLSRFHTHGPISPKLVEKVDTAIKRDPKASVIRSPSSYAYQP